MRVDLLIMDGGLEALTDDIDVLCYFFEEEIRGEFLAGLAFPLVSVELDDAGVVEVADLLKTCLEDIAFDVAVDLAEGFQFFHDLTADGPDCQLVVRFVQQITVDITEGEDK